MCLAIPALIIEIAPGGEQGRVSLGGVAREISLALLEDPAVGDYVLVHVGYALNRISPEEAARTLELMRESGLLAEALGEAGVAESAATGAPARNPGSVAALVPGSPAGGAAPKLESSAGAAPTLESSGGAAPTATGAPA